MPHEGNEFSQQVFDSNFRHGLQVFFYEWFLVVGLGREIIQFESEQLTMRTTHVKHCIRTEIWSEDGCSKLKYVDVLISSQTLS